MGHKTIRNRELEGSIPEILPHFKFQKFKRFLK